MKNLKFLLVIFLGSIVWNCANPGLGDEDGELPSVKSFTLLVNSILINY